MIKICNESHMKITDVEIMVIGRKKEQRKLDRGVQDL